MYQFEKKLFARVCYSIFGNYLLRQYFSLARLATISMYRPIESSIYFEKDRNYYIGRESRSNRITEQVSTIEHSVCKLRMCGGHRGITSYTRQLQALRGE